jgi:hypothetical protein
MGPGRAVGVLAVDELDDVDARRVTEVIGRVAVIERGADVGGVDGEDGADKCLGPETGRELMISSPGGVFDAFIDEVATSMTAGGSPTGGPVVDFRAIAAKDGIDGPCRGPPRTFGR